MDQETTKTQDLRWWRIGRGLMMMIEKRLWWRGEERTAWAQPRSYLNATEWLGAKAGGYGRTPDREGAPDLALLGAEAASLASHANARACINLPQLT
jgi:hypothetical protein